MENVEIPSEMLEKANAATAGIIPEKSKSIYNKKLKEFQDWKIKEGVKDVNEDVLLTYFFSLSEKLAPSTLWFHVEVNFESLQQHSKFRRLVVFLKSKYKHFQPKKSKVSEREQIEHFLREALDEDHLMNKVALILGVQTPEASTSKGATCSINLPQSQNDSNNPLASNYGFTINDKVNINK